MSAPRGVTTNGGMIGRLGMVILVAGDLRRSLRFYRDLLGMALVDANERWAELDAGSIHLSLHASGADVGPNPTAGCSLGLFVDDVAAVTETLRERGARIGREPFRNDYGAFAVVLDPDGYRIQLLEL